MYLDVPGFEPASSMFVDKCDTLKDTVANFFHNMLKVFRNGVRCFQMVCWFMGA